MTLGYIEAYLPLIEQLGLGRITGISELVEVGRQVTLTQGYLFDDGRGKPDSISTNGPQGLHVPLLQQTGYLLADSVQWAATTLARGETHPSLQRTGVRHLDASGLRIAESAVGYGSSSHLSLTAPALHVLMLTPLISSTWAGQALIYNQHVLLPADLYGSPRRYWVGPDAGLKAMHRLDVILSEQSGLEFQEYPISPIS